MMPFKVCPQSKLKIIQCHSIGCTVISYVSDVTLGCSWVLYHSTTNKGDNESAMPKKSSPVSFLTLQHSFIKYERLPNGQELHQPARDSHDYTG